MINFTEIKMKNLGVLHSRLPEDLWADVKESIDRQVTNKDQMKKLKEKIFPEVSGIAETIKIQLSNEFHKYISDLSLEYMRYFDQDIPKSVIISSLWANLQKKHEYRPYHSHWAQDDTYLSFVLYANVPYSLANEDNLPNHKESKIFRNSRLEFIYHTFDGRKAMHQVDVDKSFEGSILIFPTQLFHIVYPFYTSDNYRISIAGNCQFIF